MARNTDIDQHGRGKQGDDPVVVFDYALLDPETRIKVEQKTGEIKTVGKRVASDICEMGEKFAEVRDLLSHKENGGFEGWYHLEGFSKAFVYRCLAVHEQFSNRSNLERLDIAVSALYLMVSPSTPEPAKRQLIERAESGEKITHKKATALIQENKPVTKPPKKSFAVTYTAPVDDYVEDVPAVDLESTSDNRPRVSPLPHAEHRPFTAVARPAEAARIEPGKATEIGHYKPMTGAYPEGGTPPRMAPELRRGGCYAADALGNIIDTSDGRILSADEIVTVMNSKAVQVAAPEPTLELVGEALGVDPDDMIELASTHTPKVIIYLAQAIQVNPESPENPLEVLTGMAVKLGNAKKVKGGKKAVKAAPSNHRELFGAICEVFHYVAKLTTPERSRIGKVAKELSEVGALVEDIAGLHRYCTSQYDNFTENAFLTNWSAYRASDSYLKAHTRLVPDETPTPARERPIQDFELEAIPATGEARAQRAEEIFQQVLRSKSVRAQKQAS